MSDPYEPPSVTEAPPLPPAATLSSDERMWGMIGHLSALGGLVFPLGNILGPLIVWQVKKDTMPFAAAEAKEALNFQITWSIAIVLASVVAFILSFVVIGFLLFPVIGLAGLAIFVFAVIGGLKANEGRSYRYPMTIRMVN